MSSDENACIRYIMKEMDPSEELVFENEMLEDENLLIEVESLRSVNRRLGELPLIDPPESLTDDLLTELSVKMKERQNRQQIRYTIMSAAATVLMVVLAGGWMLVSDNYFGNGSDTTSTAGAILPEFGYMNSGESGASASVSPWIDNNQVLEFRSQDGTVYTASFDSIYRSSYEKLEPLDQADNIDGQRLRLTGSQ